ncbi:glycosyltransferase [Mameliella alba]|uniref:glycosyltransferase n=1 Tax=Mameliella alba TaxID=561184 RepID=UPI000B5315FE|nr:glycosyltransferase [Mameliella alba]MBY6122769.1 putative rhamnosyl transferase [Mameliella alba]OWV36035.1 hypothetical protein CDZ95_28440 [Mameliella alba]OWV51126.1 hypothetical protein CDZ97_27755 [Mameliella alba]
MQVIGFCRFSYPAEGGFQVAHSSLQERMAYLYAPDRMEERFRHFECLCLPGLRAQTDPDFLFAILVGDAMPTGWLERLAALVEGFPQAVIVSRPPGPHRQVCQDVINSLREPGQPCLQFRHDDDDAVAVDFVQDLRQAARDVAPLLDRHRLVGFDWNRGYIGRPDAKGICAELQVTPYWGVAQAIAARPGARQTIMNFAHNKLNQFMPTVTFTDKAMYLRGHNDHNDSRQKKHVKPVALPRLDAEAEAELKARFAIDADHVRQVFA